MRCVTIMFKGNSVRRFNLSGKSLAIFVAGLVVGLGVALGVALWWTAWRPPSPLTTGLPSEWQAASAQFDARVRARFAPGTPIPTFLSELNAEGFEPTWFEAGGAYGLKRKESDFPCVIVARIYWRAEKNGTVSNVRGRYGEDGCL
jgi:hypothetical protein